MKILDRYIARNFLTGYCISFCVLIGLRIIIDLFVNLDEFTEHDSLSAMAVVVNMLTYYAMNSALYFRDFAGMITVVAASFSLSRMIRSNELVAVMASGVSLKRVIAPIILLAVLLTGVLVIDQEIIIPSLGEKLVRSHDDIPGKQSCKVLFMTDGNGSLICSYKFDVETATLHNVTIITRDQIRREDDLIWQTTGRIDATRAVYDHQRQLWALTEGKLSKVDSNQGRQPVETYVNDIKPKDIPVRMHGNRESLLSFAQLSALAAQETKITDLAQLYSQKQFHITEPIINLTMLLLSLPILVCRDPKTMKTAIMVSFTMTGLCLMTNFGCKLIATEVIFNRVMPEFWAWVPVAIFLPIAFIELDSMKT